MALEVQAYEVCKQTVSKTLREFWLAENGMSDIYQASSVPPQNDNWTETRFKIHVREVSPAIDEATQGLVEALIHIKVCANEKPRDKFLVTHFVEIASEALASYRAWRDKE